MTNDLGSEQFLKQITLLKLGMNPYPVLRQHYPVALHPQQISLFEALLKQLPAYIQKLIGILILAQSSGLPNQRSANKHELQQSNNY